MFSISPLKTNGQAQSSSLDASAEDYSDAPPLLQKRSASVVKEVIKVVVYFTCSNYIYIVIVAMQ